MKGSGCSYKLRCDEYLELIYRGLSDNMYTKLTCKRISYREITYVYRKTHDPTGLRTLLATSNAIMSQVLLPMHRVLCRKWDSSRSLDLTSH